MAETPRIRLAPEDKAPWETLVPSEFMMEIGKEDVFITTPKCGEPMIGARAAGRAQVTSNLDKESAEPAT